MQVSKSWCEEVAKEIIYEFEDLLLNNDIKINNSNQEENEFENENSYINKKDYKKIKKEITRQLCEFADYIEYRLREAA